METNKYILQKLKKSVNSEFERAEVYYGVLSLVNNLGLTEREIQLIAFTAIRGNITNANVRNEFCKKHNSSYNTIKNIVWKLKIYGIFTKQNNKKDNHRHSSGKSRRNSRSFHPQCRHAELTED